MSGSGSGSPTSGISASPAHLEETTRVCASSQFNGIRNPFSYQPWREKRTFDAMFDALEADIVIFQETKIQRKDLRDDMVLIPGWDCYFSLPKVKKAGYSGVVIYTRNATCAPTLAEEGITGVHCRPMSSTPYRSLPEAEQIGGYPTDEQLSLSEVDPVTLDSEGRCVVLEFPAFVLLGVYCPATRDESRDDFRLGFLNALEARIRNLVAMGKRVILTGDINIAPTVLDSAPAKENIRKGNLTEEEYISSSSRRMFNQLIKGGHIIGERDDGRENPVLLDLCREFHPDRRGMYTCWEQRVNARPGNYGARIDHVLCSLNMGDWFDSSDIQEGLMGSDHCPVHAILKDNVQCDGREVNILDIMNPPGTFERGNRLREYSTKNLPPLSGRLIPEFDRRRSIKDMFFKKPTTPAIEGKAEYESPAPSTQSSQPSSPPKVVYGAEKSNGSSMSPSKRTAQNDTKRVHKSDDRVSRAAKRFKQRGESSDGLSKGQRTLKGFFKPPPSSSMTDVSNGQQFVSNASEAASEQDGTQSGQETPSQSISAEGIADEDANSIDAEFGQLPLPGTINNEESKESWTKLFSRKVAPKCEGHNEPCLRLVTKKPGINCGRSFWICPRPIGPSGNKETGTQWRCPTFIWSSDLNSSS
ncbi:exodeoxyribonuclease III [Polytolypa hystricis UAMH7299]|uniref:DNA-(apurinic or apyrimidinic site) endonuclease 2 n=1 Tax=Polytolypa hystricis (strain UAMH7299) TaxID=1447883 RepID=A0A2B7Z0D1_POLH7|nr:exodeoxyribonuclease III [Polytolypa hystricis UAMH7299]